MVSEDSQNVKALEEAERRIEEEDENQQVLNAAAAKVQHWETRLRMRVGAAIENFVLPRQWSRLPESFGF